MSRRDRIVPPCSTRFFIAIIASLLWVAAVVLESIGPVNRSDVLFAAAFA
jgi:hypothetical protein